MQLKASTRTEFRRNEVFKGDINAPNDGVVAYSTITGLYAATNDGQTWLYRDTGLIGKDLDGFISCSFGNLPSGGFGLGDDQSPFRTRDFSGLAYQCLRFIALYDSMPE